MSELPPSPPSEAPFRITPDPRYASPFTSDLFPGDFVRTASPSISPVVSPNSPIPAFLIVRPFPPSNSPVSIDCSRSDSPRCGTCQTFLSPFSKIPAKAKSWRCPFCNHVNSTIHFTSVYDMRPGSADRPELHHLVYDVLPPRILDGRRGKARVFVLLIDEALLNIEQPSFSDVLNQLRRIPEVARPTDQLALVTFSEDPSIFNLTSQTARVLPEFNPALLLPTLSKNDFFSNVEFAFPAVLDMVTALGHKEKRSSAVFTALRWATALMEGTGGRLILFTSGRATDPELNILSSFLSKSISLSIFKRGTVARLEWWSQITSGVVSSLANFPMLASLFAPGTAWAASAIMRTNQAAVITKVMGPWSVIEEGGVILPALGPGNALIFELKADQIKAGDLLFQVAIRYLDDEGVLRVRVINGQLPIGQKLSQPLDEGAIALFLSRQLAYERNEGRFGTQVRFVAQFLGLDSIFPLCVFAGAVRDQVFALTASVEKLLLTVLITVVEVDGVEFKIVWEPDFTVVFPHPDERQAEILQEAGRSIGAGEAEVFFPDSEEEFARMNLQPKEAAAWFEDILAK